MIGITCVNFLNALAMDALSHGMLRLSFRSRRSLTYSRVRNRFHIRGMPWKFEPPATEEYIHKPQGVMRVNNHGRGNEERKSSQCFEVVPYSPFPSSSDESGYFEVEAR